MDSQWIFGGDGFSPSGWMMWDFIELFLHDLIRANQPISYYVRFYFHLLFKKIFQLSILCFHINTAVAVDICTGDLDETERIWVFSKKSAQKNKSYWNYTTVGSVYDSDQMISSIWLPMQKYSFVTCICNHLYVATCMISCYMETVNNK